MNLNGIFRLIIEFNMSKSLISYKRVKCPNCQTKYLLSMEKKDLCPSCGYKIPDYSILRRVKKCQFNIESYTKPYVWGFFLISGVISYLSIFTPMIYYIDSHDNQYVFIYTFGQIVEGLPDYLQFYLDFYNPGLVIVLVHAIVYIYFAFKMKNYTYRTEYNTVLILLVVLQLLLLTYYSLYAIGGGAVNITPSFGTIGPFIGAFLTTIGFLLVKLCPYIIVRKKK